MYASWQVSPNTRRALVHESARQDERLLDPLQFGINILLVQPQQHFLQEETDQPIGDILW